MGLAAGNLSVSGLIHPEMGFSPSQPNSPFVPLPSPMQSRNESIDCLLLEVWWRATTELNPRLYFSIPGGSKGTQAEGQMDIFSLPPHGSGFKSRNCLAVGLGGIIVPHPPG